MLSLLLSTLEMMGLTFAIGFFVAGVIKIIAISADSMDYYHSHNEEMTQISKINKLRAKIGELLGFNDVEENISQEDEREEFRRGINTDMLKKKQGGYYHGVSHGSSRLNLMDYYYPRDTHMMYLHKKEQFLKKNKEDKNNPPTEKE